MKLLVTGGCGFIGSNFVRGVLASRKSARIVNMDALTYAGNPENLRDIEKDPRYEFVRASIVDEDRVDALARRGFDAIVNFAAESHVDRSLYGPQEFVRTNVQGTVTLLEAAKRHGIRRFLQVSTDEVYGSLPPEGMFTESTPLHPNNPYSSTKAAADLMVQSYVHTFGVEALITRSSNNYGPYQYPEKFIPLFISNAIEGRPCPLYGDGMHIRDWLHVEDNGRGILAALEKGQAGEVYNLGGGNERPNLVTARAILKLLGKSEFTVRGWCRNGRGHAQNQGSGRGKHQACLISHDELHTHFHCSHKQLEYNAEWRPRKSRPSVLSPGPYMFSAAPTALPDHRACQDAG